MEYVTGKINLGEDLKYLNKKTAKVYLKNKKQDKLNVIAPMLWFQRKNKSKMSSQIP